MKLTPENKAHIDGLNYFSLLEQWRNSPAGNLWFQDETGIYWEQRMRELRAKDNAQHVAASKAIGWEGRS